jgi:hypothetical protein
MPFQGAGLPSYKSNSPVVLHPRKDIIVIDNVPSKKVGLQR